MTQPAHKSELLPEQVMEQINKILVDNGMTIALVAVGKRSGVASPVEDFMPDSHEAAMRIVEKPE